MANEIYHNYLTGKTLYVCRFRRDGEVFLANASASEVWGTAGRDADDYDVVMTETNTGNSMHYLADFDASENINEGTYRISIYEQATGIPLDSDVAIAQGEIVWTGVEEDNSEFISSEIIFIREDLAILAENSGSILNRYDDRPETVQSELEVTR